MPAKRSRPEVHALAHLINHALGNVGKTVEFIARVDAGPADQIGSLRELVRRHERRRWSRRWSFWGEIPRMMPRRISVSPGCWPATRSSYASTSGSIDDETAQLCHWHVPEAHCLESWSDLRAFDGTASIQQPLIAPLYKGKSAHELLAVLLGEPDQSGLEIIRDYWRRGISRAILSRPGERHSRPGSSPIPRASPRRSRRKSRRSPFPLCRQTRARRILRYSFAPTRRSVTVGGPITAGSRNCPSP